MVYGIMLCNRQHYGPTCVMLECWSGVGFRFACDKVARPRTLNTRHDKLYVVERRVVTAPMRINVLGNSIKNKTHDNVIELMFFKLL